MFFMPVDPATPAEETDLAFHINVPLLREDVPKGVFDGVSADCRR
jgi:hypothetical protein